jgi:hypothetical protein
MVGLVSRCTAGGQRSPVGRCRRIQHGRVADLRGRRAVGAWLLLAARPLGADQHHDLGSGRDKLTGRGLLGDHPLDLGGVTDRQQQDPGAQPGLGEHLGGLPPTQPDHIGDDLPPDANQLPGGRGRP